MSLRIRDLNQPELYVHIRESKFYKLRGFTYNHKVGGLIDTFLKWREAQGACAVHPKANSFLVKKGLDMRYISFG